MLVIVSQNDSGDYPLHLAVLSGSEVKVRTLLDHGAVVDAKRVKVSVCVCWEE